MQPLALAGHPLARLRRRAEGAGLSGRNGDRELTANHEAGHAIVGMHTPGAEPVRKVSIVLLGGRVDRALGHGRQRGSVTLLDEPAACAAARAGR